ncbi:transmembrane protein, putative [Rhizoctonia solani AG-3 Rhs1AP]|uniref:Transmembrane protein, putative n=1 Tax=Rhizoctonia solani AG-3 Rhs1AP TaxID=1086054 RepID=X8JGZ7_9AGAM|nr:transmembrane protein, putative [Rhizoctonia solani AG-3 Rhs1AP]
MCRRFPFPLPSPSSPSLLPMSRSAPSSIPTATSTPTRSFEAYEAVVTDAPRLVPIELVMQRRKRRSQKRQNLPDSCGNVGNDILSCYPTDNTTVVQGGWTRFVWNYRYPEYIGYGSLDIYLFHADSGTPATSWTNVPNDSEWVGVSVGDHFWGTRGVSGWQDGRNQTMPFYFVAVSAGAGLNGGEPRQATFTAIQTRLPDSYFQSISSVASVSSIASMSQTSMLAQSTASLSSVAATASASASATAGLGNGNGSLQNGAGNSSFPKWAIALLVILGALALAALMLLGWVSARNLRTRQRRRQSTGSSTPIMAAPVHQPTQPESSTSPIEHPPASIIGRPVSIRRGGSLINANDGASTRSGETGPISGQDAAILAGAFRAMMRKPDFASRPDEEGESPEEKNARELKEQLAEEGRDIQSVRSERGVRVHTTAEDGSEDGWGPSVRR